MLHAGAGLTVIPVPCHTWEDVTRPRPFDKVVEELAGIENNRLFMWTIPGPEQEWKPNSFEMIPMKSGSVTP